MPEAPEVAARAFLSYAHGDDIREGGRIQRLATKIADEFETLTGTTLNVFVDSAGIGWGDDFRARLDEALQQTTFFIPVLTPTYFLRDECRKEMTRFVSSARGLGLDQLLLSIRYVAVDDLVEGSADDLKDISARMQYEPWDGLRLAEETSTEYRTAINRLASRLVRLTRDLESVPVALPPTARPSAGSSTSNATALSKSGTTVAGDEEDDAPGFLELMADLDPSLEHWAAILNDRYTPVIGEVTEYFNEATQKVTAANQKPNSFAANIAIARDLALRIEEPVSRLEEISKDYSSTLLKLDPMMRALLSSQLRDPEGNADSLASIKKMIFAAQESAQSTREAADSARESSNMSRDLRPIMRRYETALRNVSDAQSIIDGWLPLLE